MISDNPQILLKDTPEWRWRRLGKMTEPEKTTGRDEYHHYLAGNPVTGTFEEIGAYVDRF